MMPTFHRPAKIPYSGFSAVLTNAGSGQKPLKHWEGTVDMPVFQLFTRCAKDESGTVKTVSCSELSLAIPSRYAPGAPAQRRHRV